jgi:predicted CXXCH cytochrome family protein
MVRSLKHVALAALAVFAISGAALAQEGINPIQVEGISPAMIAEEGLTSVWADIMPTAGIPTVHVGHRIVLAAAADSLGSMAWEITQAPDGSTVLGDTETDTVFSFVPDSVGSYEVSLVLNEDGETHTLWVTAGNWVGGDANAEDPTQPQCTPCHTAKIDGWKTTSHAYMATKRNLTTSFMNQSCMECHATGWDSTTWSDDFGFLFPTPSATAYDSIVTNHPEQAVQFNVQCEACHGPASEHMGATDENQVSVSWKAATCAQCHDEPEHHPEPIAWDNSLHANYGDITAGGHASGSSCTKCHTAQGFVNETIKGGAAASYEHPDAITCAACHDPHDGTAPFNLRRGSVAEACTGCHTLRLSSYSGIHHSHQGSMLAGKDGMEFKGYDYPSSAHSEISDACATCHMAGVPQAVTDLGLDPGEAARIVGGHTFNVVGTYEDQEILNDTGCMECHGSVTLNFVEQSQDNIMTLLDSLKSLLPTYETQSGAFAAGDPIFSGSDLTEAEKGAAYNYYFVTNDGSYGVHNSRYAEALLRSSIEEVQKTSVPGEIVSITDAPNDQGKVVRVLWNAHPAEGAASSTVTKYQIVRWDDMLETWVVAGEVTASGLDRYALDVATDFDSTADMGIHWSFFQMRAIGDDGTVYVSNADSAYSIDNLEPMAPANAKYVKATGKLAWSPSQSGDVKYYAVYRTDLNGTLVIDGAPYVTVADTSAAVELDYRYGVVAVDFAGNVSDLSPSAQVDVLGIASNPVPATTALLGNAPNPFNPSTEVRYQLHEASNVTLTVYNVLGQPVRTLISGAQAAGTHSVRWDGLDNTGHSVGSGAYLYVMTTKSGFRATGRMMLLR